MKQIILAVLLLLFVLSAFAVCSGNDRDDDGDTDTAPAAAVESPAPPATPEPPAAAGLDAACLPGGVLTDVAIVIACNREAMLAQASVSFDGAFNIAFGLVGPGGGAVPPAAALQGSIVPPDRYEVRMQLGPAGEAIDTTARLIGDEFYVQIPGAPIWFRGAPGGDGSVDQLRAFGALYLPVDFPTVLRENTVLEDGSAAYVLFTEEGELQAGAGEDEALRGAMTRIVGADDFLARSVTVTVPDLGGEHHEVVSIRYHSYGEAITIDAPANAMELPPEAMTDGSGTGAGDGMQAPPGAPTTRLLGFRSDADGNVVMEFDGPVTTVGDVTLYMTNPRGEIWQLPLLSGAGSDMLVFDGSPPGQPALVAGESVVDGLGYEFDARITTLDGQPVNDYFDPWTYE